MTRLALTVLVLGLAACSDKADVEKWEPVMGQSGFALQGLHFDEHNLMHAVGNDGTTLVRRAEWNAWAPLPTIAAVTGLPGATIPRAWDANGNVYFSERVIYRMAKGETDWKLVPGSVGKTLVTVDPAGNVYATGPKGSEVLPAGAQAWVTTPLVTRVDEAGRAYAINHRLDGATETVDDAVFANQPVLSDARGDLLEFTFDQGTGKVTRRAFASKQATTLASFPMRDSLRLLGCGLEGTCDFFLPPSRVFRSRGGALEQIGDTSRTSKDEELNFSGFSLWVGADGLVYVSDVSGQTISYSRVYRLKPGGTWPEVTP